MSKEKPNDDASADPALLMAAEEELDQACALGWPALAKVTPWGDAFDGFAPNGAAVTFERAYVWEGAIGGDIRCEVTVYRSEASYEDGARLSRMIRRPD